MEKQIHHKPTFECSFFSPDAEETTRDALLAGYSTPDSVLFLTENADGVPYFLAAHTIGAVVEEWNGDCEGIPSNDAPVTGLWVGGKRRDTAGMDFESVLHQLAG